MTLTLPQLESCVALMRRYASDRGLDEIDDSRYDYYWKVLSKDWLNFDGTPDTGVGSFADDIAELHKLLQEPNRASAVDLERIAAMFSMLSQLLQDSARYDSSIGEIENIALKVDASIGSFRLRNQRR